jgi:hypothetical protein
MGDTMGSDDSFENRIKAFADQLARQLSDTDVDEVADRFGIDPERVRGVTGAVERWLNDRGTEGEPLFGERPAGKPQDPRAESADPPISEPAIEADSVPEVHRAPEVHRTAEAGGPHPLDTPTEGQGRALSALDSGRWTLRSGSGRLTAAVPTVGALPEGAATDLANELRARDWITADGAVTLIGRQALLRWARDAGGDSVSD